MTRVELDAWLTRKRYKQALAVALKRTDSYEDARDVLHQALERMAKAHGDIESDSTEKMGPWPWLVSAIRSTAQHLHRGRKRAKLAQKEAAGASLTEPDEHRGSHYAGPIGIGLYDLQPDAPCGRHGGMYARQRIEAGYDLLYPSGSYVPYVLLVRSCLNGGRVYESADHLLGPRDRRESRRGGPNHIIVVIDKELASCL